MTPPCANCHGAKFAPLAPATQFNITPLPGKDTQDTLTPTCTAKPHWPQWLKSDYPDLKHLSWWVRSNFEETKRTLDQAHGKKTLPFRIQVAKADAHLNLKPETIHFSIPVNKWFMDKADIDINSGPQGKIESRLKVRCNHIPLQMQSLLTFFDIDLDAPVLDVTPIKVSVGDFGELHILGKPDETFGTLINVLTPFGVPRPPPGRDWAPPYDSSAPYGQCLNERQVMAAVDQCLPPEESYDQLCASPFVYDASVRKTGIRDWVKTELIPSELLTKDARLPNYFELEDLILRIMKLVERLGAKKKKTPSKFNLEKVLTYLRPGSSLTLDLDQIEDLFLPGILDLGESNAKVQVTLAGDRTFWGEISTLNLNLDPMDYPAENTDKRPPIHLEGARIWAGTVRTNRVGEIIEPGIRFHFDPKSKTLSIQGNVDLNADVTLPPLGSFSVQAGILFEMAFQWKPDGLKILPGKTHVEIQNLDFYDHHKNGMILSKTSLLFTDQPRFFDPLVSLLGPALNPVLTDHSQFQFELSGNYKDYGSFLAESRFKMPLDYMGDYDTKKIMEELDIPLEAQFPGEKNKTYHSSLRLNSFPMEGLDLEDWHNWGYQLSSDIHRTDANSSKKQPILETGILRWEVKRHGRMEDILEVNFDAKAFHHSKFLLRDVVTALQLERGHFSETITKIRVPKLNFSANAKGSERGLFRGPLVLEQKDNVVLEVLWDKPKRRLNLKNLNLGIKAHGLDALNRKARKVLPAGVRFVGLDGGLQGHFEMNFTDNPKNWHGKGHLTLRGDRKGDLYWMSRGGRRIGPPIFRNTRWNFYRVNRINLQRAYALGGFRLNTIFNPKALFFKDPSKLDPNRGDAYGVRGQSLRPFEFEWQMSHDNMPWSLKGYINRSADYINALCAQDPDCAPRMSLGGKRP